MPVDDTNAKIRFIPNENFNGTAEISYVAWDQAAGTAGSVIDLSQFRALGDRTRCASVS